MSNYFKSDYEKELEARVLTSESDIDSAGETLTQKENYVYNAGIGLRNWRAALAKVLASGIADSSNTILDVPIIHDSIGEGYNVWSSGIAAGRGVDYLSSGWIGLLQSKFVSKLGFDDVGRGLMHPYITGVEAGGDPMYTFAGSTWAKSGSYGVMGYGKEWSGTSNGSQTATVSFNGDGVAILYRKRAFHSHFTYNIDGAGAVDVDTYNATQIDTASTIITGLGSGNHTLVITKAIGDSQSFIVQGIYEVKGSKGIRIHRCGAYGTTINKSVFSTGNMYAEIDYWNPPLTIIAMTANDHLAQTSLTSYEADIQTLITRAKVYGDVMLVAYVPKQTADSTTIKMSQYADVQKKLAIANNCCFVDLLSKWGNYATANAQGLMADTVHPNAAGHQAIANDIWNVLVA